MTPSVTQNDNTQTDQKRAVPLGAASKLMRVCAVGGGLFLIALLLRSSSGQRVLLALSVGIICFLLMVRTPRVGLPLIAVYLAFLGGLRHWLLPIFGWVTNDPLVLVGPALVFPYFLNLFVGRRLHRDTRLGYLLLWLLGIMALEILNPLQGGLVVGIAGALFYIVPLLWYHVARDQCSLPTLEAVFRVVVATAVLGALYGLYQTWFGFSEGERAWLKLTIPFVPNFNVGNGLLRPFSFFNSVAEYVTWLTIADVVLWAAVLHRNRLALVPFLFVLLAIFLSGVRGATVNTLATCTVLWAVQGATVRSWLPRGVFALVLAGVGLVWSLQQVQQVDFGGNAQNLLSHQEQGITDPTDPGKSTAGTHTTLLLNGYLQGFRNPIGIGLGGTTLAASKFGVSGNDTEVDTSNMFVSLGLLGGPLYLIVFGFTLVIALRYWHFTRSLVALQIVAVLSVVQGHWLSGGMYVVVMLLWTCIGALDSAQKKLPAMAISLAWKRPV